MKAKEVNRTNLYYGKYEYRLVVTSPHMFYSWSCNTIDDYKQRIKEVCDDFDASGIERGRAWRHAKPEVTDEEYQLIENLLNLPNKYTIKKDFTFRREGKNCNVYTSNTNIVKEVLSFYPNAEIAKVDLAPTGIKYFKKDPPAKYRTYMSNNKTSPDFKQDMLDYMKRTPDIYASNAFYTFLKRPYHYHYKVWLWNSYFVDYNDEKNLTMMKLLFPEAIGKTYKLEKKP